MSLVKDVEYSFTFWAQSPGKYTSLFSSDSKELTLTADFLKSMMNDDSFDAFFTKDKFKVTEAFVKDETLTRPFAQLNVGALAGDFTVAQNSGIAVDETMTTGYVISVPNKLNILTGEIDAARTDVEMTLAAHPVDPEYLVVAGTSYDYVAMAYVLAGEKELQDVTLKLKTLQNGTDLEISRSVANVPLQRNYRTNILGNFFSVKGQFNITVDPIYQTTDYDYTNTLQLALFKGGNVTVTENADLDKQLVAPKGVATVLDMGGKTFSNTVDLWDESVESWSLVSVQGGVLTITGEGTFQAKENDEFAADVRDGGHLVIENGTFNGNISAIYVYDGTLEIKGGTFDLQQLSSGSGEEPYRYMLNCLDANYKNGTAKVIVSGGRFHKFNPGNNAAEGAGTNFLAPGYKAVPDGDWYEVVPEDVTALADSSEDIQTAIGESENPYIVLTADVKEADGIMLSATSPKTMTIDLNGKTLELNGPVGSTGTQTQALHLEKGSTVVIKNGTISATAGSGMRMLIQNYANLTLENVTLDGSNLSSGDYTMSNNCGVVNIIGSTSIIAPANGYAFDACVTNYYPAGTQITVNTTGTISGKVEYGVWGSIPAENLVSLDIQGGTFTGSLVVDSRLAADAADHISVTGGTFSDNSFDAYRK